MWLQKNITTDTLLSPELLHVSLSGERPDDLAAILNGVMEAYLKDFEAREQIRTKERIDQLKATHRDIVQNLRVKRQDLQRLMDRYGLEDPKTVDGRLQAALQQLTAAQTQQRDLLLRLTAAESELASERGKVGKPLSVFVDDLTIDNELKDDPRFKSQKEEYARVQSEIQFTISAAAESVREERLRP